MSARRALVTGVAGQDGSYLAEHLLELGDEVETLGWGPRRSFADLVGEMVAADLARLGAAPVQP